MRNYCLRIILCVISVAFFVGCTNNGDRQGRADTLYTAEAAMEVFDQDPERALVIIDSGVAFDPTVKEKADTSLSAEDRQIGGLGILLVRELMDAINYERNNVKNVLTLIKNI